MKIYGWGLFCLLIFGLSRAENHDDSSSVAEREVSTLSKIKEKPPMVEASECESRDGQELSICKKKILTLTGKSTDAEVGEIFKNLAPLLDFNEKVNEMACGVHSMILKCYYQEVKLCNVSQDIVDKQAQNKETFYSLLLLFKTKCRGSKDGEVSGQEYFTYLKETINKKMQSVDPEKKAAAKIRVKQILAGLPDATIPPASSIDQSTCQSEPHKVVKPCFAFGEKLLTANEENIDVELRMMVLPEVILEDLSAEKSLLGKEHFQKFCQLLSGIKECLLEVVNKCETNMKANIFINFTLNHQPTLGLLDLLCSGKEPSIDDTTAFKQLSEAVSTRLKELTSPANAPSPDVSKCGETEANLIVAPCIQFIKEQLGASSDEDLQSRKKALSLVLMSKMEKRNCGEGNIDMAKFCKMISLTNRCFQSAEEKCAEHRSISAFISEYKNKDRLMNAIANHCKNETEEGDKMKDFLKSVQFPDRNDQSVSASACAEGGFNAFRPCMKFAINLLDTDEIHFDTKLLSIVKEVERTVLEDDLSKAKETVTKVCKMVKLSIKCYEDGVKTCSTAEETRKYGEYILKWYLPLRRALQFCTTDADGIISIEKLKETMTKIKETEVELPMPKEVSLSEEVCSTDKDKVYQPCVNLLHTTLQGADQADNEMKAIAISLLISSRKNDVKCEQKQKKMRYKICRLIKLTYKCVEKVNSKCNSENKAEAISPLESPMSKHLLIACDGKEEDMEGLSAEEYYKQLKDELYEKKQSYTNDQMTSAMTRVKELLNGLKDLSFSDVELDPSVCEKKPDEALQACFDPVMKFIQSNDENVDEDQRLFALPSVVNQEILDGSSKLEIDHLQKYCRLYSVIKNCLSKGTTLCSNNPLVSVLANFTAEHRPSMKFGALMCGASGPIITDLSAFRQLSTEVSELFTKLTVTESGPSPDLTQCSQSEAANIVAPCVSFMKNLVQASTEEDAELKKFALSQLVMRTMQQRTCGGDASNVDKLCRLLGMITKCFDNAIAGCKDHATLPSIIENLKSTDKIARVIGPECMKRWSEDKEMESLTKLQVPNNDNQPVTNCQEGGEKAFAPCLNFAKVILNIDSEFEEKLEAVSKQVEHLVFEGEIGLATPLVVKVCKLTKLVTKCYEEGITTCSNVDAVRQFGEESLKSNKALNRILQYCNPDGNGAINLNKLREVMVDVKSKEDQLKVPDQVTITEEGCNADKVYQPCTNMLETFLQVESSETVELRSLAVQRLLFVFMGDNKCGAKMKSLKDRICEMSERFPICIRSGMALCSQTDKVVEEGETILAQNKASMYLERICKDNKDGFVEPRSEIVDALRKYLLTLHEKDITPENVKICDADEKHLFDPCLQYLRKVMNASDDVKDLIERSVAFMKILDRVRKNQELSIKLNFLEKILKRAEQCFKVGMEKCKSKTTALLSAQELLMENPLLQRAIQMNRLDRQKESLEKLAKEMEEKRKQLEKELKDKEKEFLKNIKDARGKSNQDMKKVWEVVLQFNSQKRNERKAAIEAEAERMKELRKIIADDVQAVLVNIIVPDETPQVTAADCQASQIVQVFDSCSNFFVSIFNGKSDELETRMDVFSSKITEMLAEKNENFLTTQLPKICRIINKGRKCFANAIETCKSVDTAAKYGRTVISKYKLWKIGEKFCNGDEAVSARIDLVKSSNMKQCSNQGDGAKALETISQLTEKLRVVQAYITQSMVDQYLENNGLPDTADTIKVRKICFSVRSMTSEIQIQLRKKGNQCNEAAKIMMIESFQKERLPGIGEVCTLPNPINDGVAKKGKAKDKVRKTLVFMGLGHIKSALRADTNLFETCAAIEEDTIKLISHDTFRVEGVRDNTKFMGSPFLKSITVYLVDEEGNEVNLILSADLQDFAEQFDQITSKYTNIKISRVNKHKIRMEDTSRGLYLVIKKRIVNGDTPVFYVVFRGPSSVIDESSGYLIMGCLDNQKIGEEAQQQARRRKREVSGEECGQYDADVSGDETMKSEAQSTDQDVAAASQSDQKFTSENTQSGQSALKFSAWIVIFFSTSVVLNSEFA